MFPEIRWCVVRHVVLHADVADPQLCMVEEYLLLVDAEGVPVFVKVINTRKREPNREYVKEAPYRTTPVDAVITPPGWR